MKVHTLVAIVLLSSILTRLYAQQPISFEDRRWKIRAQSAMKEYYKGYNSLYLQGGIAFLDSVNFSNGQVDFDIYLQDRVSFSGLIFRVKDSVNYEEFYLRGHLAGMPDAYQYTPVFNDDPAWQLYHDQHDGVNDGFVHWKQRPGNRGFNTQLDFKTDEWTHVRLLIKDKQAELYINDNPQPASFIRELLTGISSGGFGLKTSVGAVWFANFTYTPLADLTFKTKPDDFKIITPPATISSWSVSAPFHERKIMKATSLDNRWAEQLGWKKMNTEAGGLLNISRLYPVTDSANCVLVKLNVTAASDQVQELLFGYSDRVKVFCNGKAVYSGDNGFRTRDYRYLGTIGYFQSLYLPLRKGENVIQFAVSETFGGWGLMARWADPQGITVN